MNAVTEVKCANCGTVGSIDGRILHTLRLLFTKPGLLSTDFLEYRRARHVDSVRLFLVFTALYFVIEGTAFSSMIAYNFTREMGVAEVVQVEARAHIVFKLAFVGSMFVNGAILWLCFRRQRPYYAEHMVTALHLACVAMTLTLVLGSLGRWLNLEAKLAGLMAMLFVPYSQLALKRVYPDATPVKCAVTAVGIYLLDTVIVILATMFAVILAVQG